MHDFIYSGLKTFKSTSAVNYFYNIILSVNYIFSGSIFKDNIEFTIVNSIYFTCVTITTLGYGDITPYTDVGKILVALQALLGFIVLSLFMASVINRL